MYFFLLYWNNSCLVGYRIVSVVRVERSARGVDVGARRRRLPGSSRQRDDDPSETRRRVPLSHHVRHVLRRHRLITDRRASTATLSSTDDLLFSGVPLLECCRVDYTSPDNTIVGLTPSWVDTDVCRLHIGINPPQPAGTRAPSRSPPVSSWSERRTDSSVMIL